MKITIDASLIKNEKDVHQQMKAKLEFPEYYGENLDALWDFLNSWIEYPLTIKWINYNESEKHLGDYVHKIINIFKELETEIKDFSIEIYE